MSHEDVHVHPSGHAAKVVPAAARAELEAEARQLDQTLLDGLLQRQGYGSGCTTHGATATAGAAGSGADPPPAQGLEGFGR